MSRSDDFSFRIELPALPPGERCGTVLPVPFRLAAVDSAGATLDVYVSSESADAQVTVELFLLQSLEGHVWTELPGRLRLFVTGGAASAQERIIHDLLPEAHLRIHVEAEEQAPVSSTPVTVTIAGRLRATR